MKLKKREKKKRKKMFLLCIVPVENLMGYYGIFCEFVVYF